MSTTDEANQAIQTELEITGGIITFGIILIVTISILIVLKHKKEIKKKQQRHWQATYFNSTNPNQQILGPNIDQINKTFGTKY